MFELSSRHRGTEWRFLSDERGSTASEWVVAAAIVGLFSIPVVALINSGTQSRTKDVQIALEDPSSQETLDAYAVGKDGEDGGTLGGAEPTSASDEGETETAPGYSGLNKGVGYDVDVADIMNPDRGTQTRMSTNTKNSSATGGSSGTRRPLVFSPSAAPAERSLRSRQLGGISSAQTVVRPSNAAPKQVPAQKSTVDPCGTRSQAKTIRTDDGPIESQEDLNAALSETVDESKINALLENVRIRILDEEEAKNDDCSETEVVTAAADQLDDGTVLGAVTISSATDSLPTQRRRPEGIGRAVGSETAVTPTPRRPRQSLTKLPIPQDADALQKILDGDVIGSRTLPERQSGGLAPAPSVPTAPVRRENQPTEPAQRVAALASAGLGRTVNIHENVALFAGEITTGFQGQVGAGSDVEAFLSVAKIELPKRDVPILRSGR